MVITVEQVREKYPKEYWDLSDWEIQQVLDYMYFICEFSINWHKNHPGESLLKWIKKESEAPFNEEWHKSNSMPMKGTLDQKIKWHIEHVAHCKCRPIPDKIKQEIQKRLNT